jgi:nucleotide-binding universal stress UspA family protein
MFHNLLVPLDGSAFAEQALPFAFSIARRANARLDLVRAHMLYESEDLASRRTRFDPAEDAEFRQQEKHYLEEVARRRLAEDSFDLSCVVVDGFAPDAILERAQTTAAELIVMTTHGRGPMSRAFLGSVADEVVRRSHVPVLLIRPQEALANLHERPSVSNMLIPLDGSPASEQIIGPAARLGSAFDVSYTLLHVVQPDDLPARKTQFERAAGLSRTWQEHDAEDSASYLEQVAARMRGPATEVRTHVVIRRHVASAILEEAQNNSCDLIAMAMHGRRGIGRLLIGSVSDKVLRAATVPLLLYRELSNLAT